MKVLILHTLPPDVVPLGRDRDEFNLSGAAQGITEVLPDAAVVGIRGTLREVCEALQMHRPGVVFNLCEAPMGQPELEAHVAALFEWLGVRFTGCGSETLALCRRKDRTKAVLAAAGVPVPREGLFPCIVKPVGEDGSAGLTRDSICVDAAAVESACARLSRPAIVEEFLPGREFVVALWGPAEGEYVSIGETLFLNGLRLHTYAAKWDMESADYADSPVVYDSDIEPSLRQAIVAATRGAWSAVGARGYLRVDVRLDEEGMPRVMDVNPNAAIEPGVGVHRAVIEAGWSWRDFVYRQLEWVS
jgi:D-alanine-D-alanine ligase